MIVSQPVRIRPVRRVVAAQDRYVLYREDLRLDFNRCCGYCGHSDDRQDSSTFHIDHFAPKARFPELAIEYSNLVYSCRICNISKSNHWVGVDSSVPNDGERGFIDPCASEYDANIGRTSDGRIVGLTPLGAYAVKRLKLGLLRHELLWRARRADELRVEVAELIDKLAAKGDQGGVFMELLMRYKSLTEAINEYERGAVGQ